jgi:hypothetical protein
MFTIHAGEFLVGDLLEHRFPSLHVWVPSRDTGVDLLVTDNENRQPVSLQVKSSRDFVPTLADPELRGAIAGAGWWNINRAKLEASEADFWVLVLIGLNRKRTDCVVGKPSQLLKALTAVHGATDVFRSHLWVTEAGRCIETRGLPGSALHEVAAGKFHDSTREFTAYLNDWSCLDHLL